MPWVFGLEDVFKSTTKAAILQDTSVLEAPDNLPIPGKVIGMSQITSSTVFRLCDIEADSGEPGRSDERESSSCSRLDSGRSCISARGLRSRQKRVQLGMCLLSSRSPSKLCAQMNGVENPPCSGISLTDIVYSLRDIKRPDWSSSENLNIYRYHQGPTCPKQSVELGGFQYPHVGKSVQSRV